MSEFDYETMRRQGRAWRVQKRREARTVLKAMDDFNSGAFHTPQPSLSAFEQARSHMRVCYEHLQERNWRRHD